MGVKDGDKDVGNDLKLFSINSNHPRSSKLVLINIRSKTLPERTYKQNVSYLIEVHKFFINFNRILIDEILLRMIEVKFPEGILVSRRDSSR